ncbi:MAG: hypothetical protein K1X86_04085 [Ignavibacteria bacterium]|nr:hypothetical protein [Ignavibacteria bacterium]
MKKFILILFLCSGCNIFAQWEEFSNGLYGTDISGFYFHDSTIYLSSYTGGVYKSTDWGNNWFPSNSGLNTLEVITLCFLDNTIVAGTEQGAHISRNKGESWVELKDENVEFKFHSITASICFENKFYLYNNTLGNGLLVSSDTGRTWTSYKRRYDSHDIFDAHSVELFYIANDNLYAGTTSGIYVKGESDTVWNRIDTLSKYDFVYSITAEENYMSTVCNYFPVVDGAAQISNPKIFFSADLGTSWNEIAIELDTNFITSVVFSNSTLFAATNTGLFASSDLGKSWVRKNNFKYINQLSARLGHIFISTYNDEIFRSDDNGDTWLACMNNLSALDIKFIDKLNGSLLASTYNASYLQVDSSNSWKVFYLDSFNIPITSIVVNNKEIFAGTPSNGVYKSVDNGNSWMKFSSGLQNLQINKLINVEVKIFAATEGHSKMHPGLYRLNKEETDWQILKDSLYGQEISDLLYSGSTLYAGTYRGGCFISSDKGNTWHTSRKTNDDYYSQIDFMFSIGNRDYIHFYFDDDFFYTIDKGFSWIKIKAPRGDVSCISTDGEYIFVGTYRNGIFLSKDLCKSWIKISDSINLKHIRALYIDRDYLYCGTQGSSLWRYKFK